MIASTGYCWHCAHALAAVDLGRTDECPACHRQTHVCRNCRFYRPGIHNDCQEPIAEAVTNKTRANFCDYFSPNPTPRKNVETDATADALRAAEALFRSDT